VSGIVGILRRDGGPVERPLLRSLVASLAIRGTDAEEVWTDGKIGFGHAMLRTSERARNERQPANLAGQYWITTDARIDCRKELQAQLAAVGQACHKETSDSELILHAYAAWGKDCVQHLRGDFAFALWDSRERTLFCARDHFGIKPFYYAETHTSFFFANSFGCLRLLPEISDELNDAAIADFLLFGTNYDLESTAFRDIRRLPPAHTLVVSPNDVRLQRYWSAPVDGHIRYRHSDDYVEHFQLLLKESVADRLPNGPTGILLSGGLDSSTVAAVAKGLSANGNVNSELRAYTVTYESSSQDHDGKYARSVADFLRIPIQLLPMDHLQLFDRWADPELTWPEPVEDPFFAGLFDQTNAVAQDCRVALKGEGIDNLMDFQMRPYVGHLIRKRDWMRLFREGSSYLRARESVWRGIGRRTRRMFANESGTGSFPRWIAPELEKRLNLKDRLREKIPLQVSPSHPLLPVAHASLSLPQWSQMFELESPAVTQRPVEVRYPYLDLRIVNYVLALPPFPWAFEKTLLRQAMLGHLPEAVRLRRKTHFSGDPLAEKLREPGSAWIDQAQWSGEIDRFINRAALPLIRDVGSPAQASVQVRSLCLNFWLQSSRGVRYNLYAEVHNG
jgi:asparagine synthase (glutamine-hydrolysing)